MKTPYFTVIVPVYKVRDEYLRPCLESLSNQSFRDFEAILIDDGSPDDSGERCDRFALTDDRFRVIHTPNGGVASARNRGLEEARGQWVWMVDADDWVEENALQVLFDALQDVEPCDVLQFRAFRNYEDGRQEEGRPFGADCLRAELTPEGRYRLLSAVVGPPGFALNSPRGNHVFFLWDKIFRRSFLEENALCLTPGIRMGEDQEFFFRCVMCSCRLRRVQNPLYHYRRSGDNVTARYNPWMAEDRLGLFSRMTELTEQANAELCKPDSPGKFPNLSTALNYMLLMSASQVLVQQFYHPAHPKKHRRRQARAFMHTPSVARALRKTKLTELTKLNRIRLILMRMGAYGILAALIRRSHQKNGNL